MTEAPSPAAATARALPLLPSLAAVALGGAVDRRSAFAERTPAAGIG